MVDRVAKVTFSWHFASELDWFLNIFDMEFWECNKFLILYPQNNGASTILELQLESHLPHVIPVLATSGRTLEMWLFNSFRVAWSSAKRGVPWMLYPSYWCVYCFFIMFQFIFYMLFSNEISKRVGEKWSGWSDILHSFVAQLPRVGESLRCEGLYHSLPPDSPLRLLHFAMLTIQIASREASVILKKSH